MGDLRGNAHWLKGALVSAEVRGRPSRQHRSHSSWQLCTVATRNCRSGSRAGSVFKRTNTLPCSLSKRLQVDTKISMWVGFFFVTRLILVCLTRQRACFTSYQGNK